MKPRTSLNQKIESMIATVAKPIADGTQKISAYTFPNGRQIAIQREDTKEINIWTEIFDTNNLNSQTTKRTYESKDSRSSNLKGNAPNLMQPNRAYQFKFDTRKMGNERIAKQIESLLDCYGKQSFAAMQGDHSDDSSLKPDMDTIQNLGSGLSETLAGISFAIEGDTVESRDENYFLKLEELFDPLLSQVSFQTDASRRRPLTPEQDEQRRKKQAKNGELGEQLAMQYEIARLTELGCPNSVDHVRQVSLIDVGAGFDIHSNWNGDERCIEVKASELGVDHFFISINELIQLGELRERGWIYRVDLSNKKK